MFTRIRLGLLGVRSASGSVPNTTSRCLRTVAPRWSPAESFRERRSIAGRGEQYHSPIWREDDSSDTYKRHSSHRQDAESTKGHFRKARPHATKTSRNFPLSRKFSPSNHEQINDLSSPEGKARHFAVSLDRFVDQVTATRITHWGLFQEDFISLAHTIMSTPQEDRCDTPHATMMMLLKYWHTLSKDALVPALMNNEVNEFWNGFMLNNVSAAVAVQEFRRLTFMSFLTWLHKELCLLPGAQDYVARTATLLGVADFRHPSLNYPTARTLKRHIHLHVGPTNSGKTHGALKALCNARRGVYAGPLRMLAHEVWHRINSGTVSAGIAARPCDLLTGEEKRTGGDFATLLSCTVEMLDTNEINDVAVIDEIQMIGDVQRGFAWTNAVLGVPAKEVHLCGEKSVVGLIKKMAKACGDVVHVHEYERLTPLRTCESIGSLKNVQKGDCVVAFSRAGLFEVKDEIERETGLKCAIAYGALPPETKAEQARQFNDPTNDIDVFVASDAIGMGLNLKIKRVVFTTVTKWDGKMVRPISDSQIKQIAGRAGRYDSNASGERSGGLATTLHPGDLHILEEALASPLKPITHAGIAADAKQLEKLSEAIRGPDGITVQTREGKTVPIMRGKSRPLKFLYRDVGSLMRIDPTMYYLQPIDTQIELAEIIEQAVLWTSNLTLPEQDIFSKAPIQLKDDLMVAMFGNILRTYAGGSLVSFAQTEHGLGMIDALNSVLEVQKAQEKVEDPSVEKVERERIAQDVEEKRLAIDINTLMKLESLHRSITLYMWLSMRFPTAFCFREQVESMGTQTEEVINFALRVIRTNRQGRLAALGREDSRPIRQRRGKRAYTDRLSSNDGDRTSKEAAERFFA